MQLRGPIEIGAGTEVYPYACLGFPGQDFKFKPGMPTAGVKIGAGCLIREHVTIHAATKLERPTTLGDRCLMMVNSHIGHDAVVGSDVIMANGALVAGHAQIGDRANLSGNTAVHQFNRVGRMVFISGGAVTSTDIPPYCVMVTRNALAGLNFVGMRRTGVPRDEITLARRAYREAFRTMRTRDEMLAVLDDIGQRCGPAREQAEFIRGAKRPLARDRSVGEEVMSEE